MSLNLLPARPHPSSTNIQSANKSAPSAPGIPDRLRHPSSSPATGTPLSSENNTTSSSSSTSSSAALASSHPLEARLLSWQTTQTQLKNQSMRRIFGMAEPIRRGMEMKICSEGDAVQDRVMVDGGGRAGVRGITASGGSVGSEILAGRDAEVGWGDVFGTGDELAERVGDA